MRYIFLIILLFFSANVLKAKKAPSKEEKIYQKIAKNSYTVDEINNLLIAYKDSLTIPNINSKQTAFYNLVISKLYYLLGAYNKSIDYGKVALSGYKTIKDTSFIMYALINIGAIYGENNEPDIAFDYFSQIEKLAKASNDSDALSYNYINLGTSLSGKDNKAALKYYNLAEQYKNKKNNYFKLYILIGRAGVFFKQKNYRKAVKLYIAAFNAIDSTHYFYNSLCTNIAETYKQLNKVDSSLYFAYKALHANSQYHSINNMANTFSVMVNDYLMQHKDDSVKKYFNLFKDYNDSIILNKKVEYVSKLKVINETDKLLEKNKIQKQKLVEYNIKIKYLVILAIIILLALIIVIIFYRKAQISYKKIVKESVHSIKIEEEVIRLRQKLAIDEKPKNQGTNIENSDAIFYEIIKLLEEDKLYTDHTFTLNKLSEVLGVNRTYVSNVINVKTNDSFIKLVNSYRIKEAKKMLVDEQYKNLTLEAIGKASGFKSTSSFYRVFKSETGVTPSFYIKNKNI